MKLTLKWARPRRTNTVWFHSYEVLRVGKFIKIGSGMVLDRIWGRGNCNRYGVSLGDDGNVLEWDNGDNIVNILKNQWIVYFFFLWRHHSACGILVPWPGIELAPLAVKPWSPNHWTVREFPELSTLKLWILCYGILSQFKSRSLIKILEV